MRSLTRRVPDVGRPAVQTLAITEGPSPSSLPALVVKTLATVAAKDADGDGQGVLAACVVLADLLNDTPPTAQVTLVYKQGVRDELATLADVALRQHLQPVTVSRSSSVR